MGLFLFKAGHLSLPGARIADLAVLEINEFVG